jgi:hypothetical protein
MATQSNETPRRSRHEPAMDLTNDRYVIFISFKNSTERYYRDKSGWLKVSTRGRKFRATAEQVLNHVLPALAGVKSNVTVKVEYREGTGPGRRTPAA